MFSAFREVAFRLSQFWIDKEVIFIKAPRIQYTSRVGCFRLLSDTPTELPKGGGGNSAKYLTHLLRVTCCICASVSVL